MFDHAGRAAFGRMATQSSQSTLESIFGGLPKSSSTLAGTTKSHSTLESMFDHLPKSASSLAPIDESHSMALPPPPPRRVAIPGIHSDDLESPYNGLGPIQSCLLRWVAGKELEYLMSCVIAFNFGFVIFETDQQAKCFPKYKEDLSKCPHGNAEYPWMVTMNNILLVLYCSESLLKIYALRCTYFRNKADLFDFLICIAGVVELLLDSVISLSWLRILRCVRILKMMKIGRRVKEVNALLVGFVGSMKAMFFGASLLFFGLMFVSIFIVQYLHPVNSTISYSGCARCSQGFRSVYQSTLTLFQQIIAGDSWGLISLPVIEDSPLGLCLILAQLMIGVGGMNLILAVIVDHATEARETSQAQEVRDRTRLQHERKYALLKKVQALDSDGNGSIDRSEIRAALNTSDEFRGILENAGIEESELWSVIDCISDDMGKISFRSICDVFDNIQAGDVLKTSVLCDLKLARLTDNMQKIYRGNRAMKDKLDAHECLLHEQTKILHKIGEVLDGGRGVRDLLRSVERVNRCFDDTQFVHMEDGEDMRSLHDKLENLKACTKDMLRKTADLQSIKTDRLREGISLSASQQLSMKLSKHFNYVQNSCHRRRHSLLNDILMDLCQESESMELYSSLFSAHREEPMTAMGSGQSLKYSSEGRMRFSSECSNDSSSSPNSPPRHPLQSHRYSSEHSNDNSSPHPLRHPLQSSLVVPVSRYGRHAFNHTAESLSGVNHKTEALTAAATSHSEEVTTLSIEIPYVPQAGMAVEPLLSPKTLLSQKTSESMQTQLTL